MVAGHPWWSIPENTEPTTGTSVRMQISGVHRPISRSDATRQSTLPKRPSQWDSCQRRVRLDAIRNVQQVSRWPDYFSPR